MASSAWAAGGDVETSKAKLGFIALTDAAPLFVAAEKGFFAKYGMTEVEVLKRLTDEPQRPYAVVLGGSKVSDKLGVIEHLLPRADKMRVLLEDPPPPPPPPAPPR